MIERRSDEEHAVAIGRDDPECAQLSERDDPVLAAGDHRDQSVWGDFLIHMNGKSPHAPGSPPGRLGKCAS